MNFALYLENTQLLAAARMGFDILRDIEEFDKELISKQYPLRSHPKNDANYRAAQNQIKDYRTIRSHIASTHIMIADVAFTISHYKSHEGFTPEAMTRIKSMLDQYWRVINYQRPRHDLTGITMYEELRRMSELEKEADKLVQSLQKMVG